MLLYRVLISLATPLLLAGALWRVLRGRENMTTISERLASGRDAGWQTDTLWVHAASNGEVASVKPLLIRLRAQRPDLHILITCNSQSGRDLVQSWDWDRTAARVAPLDLRWSTRRLLRTWVITGFLLVENELWPNRLAVLGEAGIPSTIVGARLSAKSHRNWARLPRLTGSMAKTITYLSAQDADSRDRFAALGVAQSRLGPVIDLKALYAPPETAPDPDLVQAFPRGETWLAASTHDGEEVIVLEAHRLASSMRPGLRLILAPRHPKRADQIAAFLADNGMPVHRRSHGAAQGPVLLADTLGEMHLWYQLAGVTFVGGSLVQRGGHTPYEPAAFDSAILTGPHTDNFQKPYKRLLQARAARDITDAATLASALQELGHGPTRTAMTDRARAALVQPENVTTLVDAILDRI